MVKGGNEMPVAQFRPETQVIIRNRLNHWFQKGIRLSALCKMANIHYKTMYSFVVGDRNLSEEKLNALTKAIDDFEKK
jgi:predicted transcriptional regulator